MLRLEIGNNNIPDDINGNEFEIELPYSKVKVKFKLLTGHDESNIDKDELIKSSRNRRIIVKNFTT